MYSGIKETTANALAGAPGIAFPPEHAQEEMARQLDEKKKEEKNTQKQDTSNPPKKEDKPAKGQ
ncbi:hypothetical protein Dda_2833 [Drechslerella dactyloides]|uniref:Uncharacterized protein n=1 Tax=Drechslerella dactyloides TaxID=74499 RepID=A0AAD6NJR6_DREDA|nr:hypothetical protein Dda_2833 [Drechslerella dactyloides]